MLGLPAQPLLFEKSINVTLLVTLRKKHFLKNNIPNDDIDVGVAELLPIYFWKIMPNLKGHIQYHSLQTKQFGNLKTNCFINCFKFDIYLYIFLNYNVKFLRKKLNIFRVKRRTAYTQKFDILKNVVLRNTCLRIN